jgi:hypothetical protein
MPVRFVFILLACCVVVSLCCVPAQASEPASVTFSLDFPGSDPENYSIVVRSDGHARYESKARISQESEEREAYQAEFEFSPSNRARVFDLAAQAHYFEGKIDSGRKVAFTGAKKLIFQDGARNNTAAYNYSNMQAVQQLTALFQNIAATLEFTRRLAHSHRYQKLALDEELKHMEDQARDNGLAELQAAHPVLQDIVDDGSVMNVVRARAQRIIAMGKSGTAGSR